MGNDVKIEIRKIDDLIPYARNPRKNDGAAVDKVAASIKEFGFRQPIVVDNEGVIIAGHTRHKAARQLGLTEVPVHVAGDLTETQARAFRIADNRTGDESTWDDELLRLEFDDLGDDLDLTGFDAEEIAALGPDVLPPDGDPDAIPEPAAEPITVEGDLWTLGEHRVLCGDSSTLTDLDRAVNGVDAFLSGEQLRGVCRRNGLRRRRDHSRFRNNFRRYSPPRGQVNLYALRFACQNQRVPQRLPVEHTFDCHRENCFFGAEGIRLRRHHV